VVRNCICLFVCGRWGGGVVELVVPVCVCVCMCACVYVCVCVCMYVYVYVYIYIYIYRERERDILCDAVPCWRYAYTHTYLEIPHSHTWSTHQHANKHYTHTYTQKYFGMWLLQLFLKRGGGTMCLKTYTKKQTNKHYTHTHTHRNTWEYLSHTCLQMPLSHT
jgi:hypothetical protein